MARKVYDEVVANFSPDGRVIPEAVVWEDDRRYEIDRVTAVQRAASLKVGGHGIRYSCRIGGKETYLFREEDRWFVEAKDDEDRRGA
jgi:hypothetical protein